MARMNKQMQAWNISRMVAGTRNATDMYDTKAHVDSRLTLSENRQNIARQLGISSRNRGLEAMDQGAAERARERIRRQNPHRQTGLSNETIDKMFLAMYPGRRTSKNGNRYYEYRSNRSDVSRTLRL